MYNSEAPPITAIQEAIIQEFAPLQSEPTLLLQHLIALGEKIGDLAESEKTEKHLVKGCLARVWILHHYHNNLLVFRGDSNAKITKGLLSLTLRLFSGQPPRKITTLPTPSLSHIGLSQFLTSQRQGGFDAMVAFIRTIANHY